MFDLKVKPDGGDEYEVTAEARDVLVWEKTSKGRTVTQIIENKSFVDLYKLAWIASRRQGLFDGSLEEFEKSCDLDLARDKDDEDDGPDPTP